MKLPLPLNTASALLLGQMGLMTLPAAAWAQATPSKISEVLVYPGGATVERVAKVAAGAQLITLSCLPARFDVDSLQVQADGGVQIGDVSVQTVERARAPECASSPLDARIRELDDQKAALAAEISAHELALDYLKRFGSNSAAATSTAPLGTTSEALRRAALDSLQKQHALQRRQEELTQQLTPLQAERDRLINANPQLRSVSIRLAAPREAELRLSYRLTQAGWTPVYRAQLDSSTGQLRLERHAQVAQSSGEDWSGVKLKLSTVQPRQANGLPAPRPWTLDLLPPPAAAKMASDAFESRAYAMAAPAPVQALAAPQREASVNFDVSVFQGEYAAEFSVPGRVTVQSDGQRVALALGSQTLASQLYARVQPQQEAAAYLVADAARPAGSWPQGPLQLFRDGTFVGSSQLRLGQEPRLELFFGRDELLNVEVVPERRDGANSGFIGPRAEQKIGRSYALNNRHSTAVTVQVIEAAPQSRHEDIRVQAQFNPKPTLESWRKLPGVVAWQLPMAPGQHLTLNADYLISYPKDARIGGLR